MDALEIEFLAYSGYSPRLVGDGQVARAMVLMADLEPRVAVLEAISEMRATGE